MRSLLLLVLILVVGCAQPSRGTVDVPVSAASLEELAGLETDDGAAFTFTTATFRFADVRLEAPPEEVTWRPALVPSAHAHPGHDFAGAAAGELLGDFEVDLRVGEQEIGLASMLEGDYASARLDWPADGPAVELAGTVTCPGGAALPFHFVIQEERQITGMELVAEVHADSPPTGLTLRLDLATMLGFTDWTTISDEDSDGTLTDADATLGNTVSFGVRTSAAWTWEIE